MVRNQQIVEDEIGWRQIREAAKKHSMQRAKVQVQSELKAGGKVLDEVLALEQDNAVAAT